MVTWIGSPTWTLRSAEMVSSGPWAGASALAGRDDAATINAVAKIAAGKDRA
jgi:hypothetical protein